MRGGDPARAGLDAAVIAWARERDWRRDDARFAELALALFAFQFERCAPYRRFCEARGRAPANVRRWQEIPAVPTGAFKELALTSFPERAHRARVPHERNADRHARRAAARHARRLRGVAARVVPAPRAARPGTGRARGVPRARALGARGGRLLALAHVRRGDPRRGHRESSHWIAGGALDVARAVRELEADARAAHPSPCAAPRSRSCICWKSSSGAGCASRCPSRRA